MRNVAIAGVGYTNVFVSKRKDMNAAEMIGESVENALRNTNLKPEDIDAIVIGNMQTFEGVNLPHLWASEHFLGVGKPVMRIATGGSTGMSVVHAAYYHVASGLFDTVLAIGWEKQSEGDSQVGLTGIVLPEALALVPLGLDMTGKQGMAFSGGGSTGAASFQAMSYLAKSGGTIEHIDKMAALERANAALNPYAHLKVPNCKPEDIAATPIVSYPLRFGHTCPTSDGSTCMVMCTAEKAAKITDKVAWVNGLANCASDPTTGNLLEGLLTDPAEQMPAKIASKKAYEMAGITDPKKELDMAELYDGFAHQSMMWSERIGLFDDGAAPEMLDKGVMNLDGEMPINPSGGTLCTNAIGASAMNRVSECALQIMGLAEGGHQVPKPVHNAVAHGWGGLFQYVTITVLGDTPRKR